MRVVPERPRHRAFVQLSPQSFIDLPALVAQAGSQPEQASGFSDPASMRSRQPSVQSGTEAASRCSSRTPDPRRAIAEYRRPAAKVTSRSDRPRSHRVAELPYGLAGAPLGAARPAREPVRDGTLALASSWINRASRHARNRAAKRAGRSNSFEVVLIQVHFGFPGLEKRAFARFRTAGAGPR